MIYFLHAVELGRIKIGFAGHVENRLLRIRDGSPVRLDLLATCPGDRAVELRLHKHFHLHRIYHEWFLENDALLHLVEALASAQETEQRAIIGGLLADRSVRLVFDKGSERASFSTCLQRWIALHGGEAFFNTACLSPEMERAVRLHGAVVGSLPFTRLLAADPIPFIGFWSFSEEQLRRLRREVEAQICKIEQRKDAA